MSTWFITGASRGLGSAIAREALSRGHNVVAAARNTDHVRQAFPDAGDKVLPVAVDVTDADQVRAAVEEASRVFGGIDVLVNNAGRGILGAIEETTDAEVRALYDLNVFGLLTVTRSVLPLMRAARGGTIVNISSAGGFVSSPGSGIYASTKFAVEGITEALRAEVAPLGITAGAVEPGFFRTDFLDASSLMITDPIEDYSATPAGAVRQATGSANHAQPGDPAKGAKVIADAVESGAFPVRLFLGADTLHTVSGKLDAVAAEVERQREAASSTSHDDADAWESPRTAGAK